MDGLTESRKYAKMKGEGSIMEKRGLTLTIRSGVCPICGGSNKIRACDAAGSMGWADCYACRDGKLKVVREIINVMLTPAEAQEIISFLAELVGRRPE